MAHLWPIVISLRRWEIFNTHKTKENIKKYHTFSWYKLFIVFDAWCDKLNNKTAMKTSSGKLLSGRNDHWNCSHLVCTDALPHGILTFQMCNCVHARLIERTARANSRGAFIFDANLFIGFAKLFAACVYVPAASDLINDWRLNYTLGWNILRRRSDMQWLKVALEPCAQCCRAPAVTQHALLFIARASK